MNKLKTLCLALLYPPVALLLVLVPVATVLLVYSMIFLGTTSPVACASYVLSAYALTVLCLRIPAAVTFFRHLRRDNRYLRVWLSDAALRAKVSLYGALLANTAYAVFHLGLGFFHASFWFHSLAAYYLLLALVRFFLVRRTGKEEGIVAELRTFRLTGWFLLCINLALALIIFFMLYWGRSFHHHEITTIAMAAYTFFAFTLATVKLVKGRRSKSPLFFAARIVALGAACVSMLTLEATMLTTFGDADPLFRRVMLGATGACISLLLIAAAIFMILYSNKALTQRKKELPYER